MLQKILALATGGAVRWWLVGAVTIPVVGYVAGSQLVLHRRQQALDDSLATSARLVKEKALLQTQLDQVVGINTENLKELALLRAGHARDMADIEAELGRARKAGGRLIVVYTEAARDPDAKSLLADACPAADRYLDRLRREAGGAGAAQDRDQDRTGAGRASQRPAVVR